MRSRFVCLVAVLISRFEHDAKTLIDLIGLISPIPQQHRRILGQNRLVIETGAFIHRYLDLIDSNVLHSMNIPSLPEHTA